MSLFESAVRRMYDCHALRRTIREEVLKQRDCGPQDVNRLLSDVVERLGVACKVRNAVYAFSKAARTRHRCPPTIQQCISAHTRCVCPNVSRRDKGIVADLSSYQRRGEMRWLEERRDMSACACQWRNRDKISTVDRAKRHWEESICEELNILASEQQRSYSGAENP